MEKCAEIHTKNRTIISEIPHPDSLPIIEQLKEIEPRSMSGFSPVVWHKAEGFHVWDRYGNKWIDFTSAVVLTNAGHANPGIRDAIIAQLDSGLWHHYCNPSEIRLETARALKGILPAYLDKIYMLSTGSEAVENAIKLARIHGRQIRSDKINILSFSNSFHGRTMASQSAGGYPDQQAWMGVRPDGFHHISFPPADQEARAGCGREYFERSLAELEAKGIEAQDIAGVITETFQGPTAAFLPNDYVAALREWTRQNRILLIFDEIQAGFGRTGKWFGFEHYGVEPDLIVMGKGMTSSLPMSAVAGRKEIMDLPGYMEMSSSHTGNPLACAAAIANIAAIREQKLLEHAAAMGQLLQSLLSGIKDKFPAHISAIHGRGLVWAIGLIKPGTREPDVTLARTVTRKCMEQGLLMLQTGRGTLKLAPPLCIAEEALVEGVTLIDNILTACIHQS